MENCVDCGAVGSHHCPAWCDDPGCEVCDELRLACKREIEATMFTCAGCELLLPRTDYHSAGICQACA